MISHSKGRTLGITHIHCTLYQRLKEFQAGLPREGLLTQHVHCLLTEVNIELYCGEAQTANECFQGIWPKLRHSFLMRSSVVRILLKELHARCMLAMATRNLFPKPFLREAERDAAQLSKERLPWADAHASLIRAGIAACRGDRSVALGFLEDAVHGYEGADMALHATIARRRLGQLLGGAAGQVLVADANSWMATQNIENAVRCAATMSPGFAD